MLASPAICSQWRKWSLVSLHNPPLPSVSCAYQESPVHWSRRQFMTASSLGVVGSIMGCSQRRSAALRTDGTPTIAAAAFRRRVDSIDWYYEIKGRGPSLVLIPSGEGDCGSFGKLVASLSTEFTVLTFDMPGFSRSGDPPDFSNYSMSRAANEVAALVRALGLGPATFYGCSSGGHIALCLAVEHAELVRNVLVHEVAGMRSNAAQNPLTALADDEIVQVCRDRFRNELNESPEAWDALGEAFHDRLERNYVTWVRRYLQPDRFRNFEPDDLRGRPVTWTIGALSPADRFIDNRVAANAAGLHVTSLMCRHFPQVSIPDALADHIASVARAHVA
jgi:pimeloyl-ACP methyl ester carboxylesterase